MIKLTNLTRTFFGVLAGMLLWPGGLGVAAGAPIVRLAGPDKLELADAAGQAQTAWTVESTIQDVLQIDTTLYVAVGPRGVLIFDLAAPEKPALIGRLAEGRNVVKLAQNGKSLLVVVADFSALTFSLAEPQKPQPAPLSPPFGGSLTTGSGRPPLVAGEPRDAVSTYALPMSKVPRGRWARVTTVRGGWVAVTASAPVQVGDRFVIHNQRRVRVDDPTLPHKVYAPSDEATGMFQISRVSGSVASGRLPRGTIAYVGDLAEPTAAPLYAPKVAPPLWYGMGRFYGTLRPILGVAGTSTQTEAAPFGMLNDFTLEYYFRAPVKLGVQVQPLGLVIGKRAGLSTELRGLLSFASSYFELGLEPGVALQLNYSSQFLLGYLLRLGSLDGLNLILHNSYAIATSSSSAAVAFSSIQLEINIPVASRFNLALSGGGAPHWAYGTVGLKYYVRGGGGPGTLIFSSGAGGAWVSDRCDYNPNSTNAGYCLSTAIETIGPMVSVGLDARF